MHVHFAHKWGRIAIPYELSHELPDSVPDDACIHPGGPSAPIKDKGKVTCVLLLLLAPAWAGQSLFSVVWGKMVPVT